jgi:hypothetical protein
VISPPLDYPPLLGHCCHLPSVPLRAGRAGRARVLRRFGVRNPCYSSVRRSITATQERYGRHAAVSGGVS